MPLNCLRLAVLSHVGHCSPAGPSQHTHTPLRDTHTYTHAPLRHTHMHTHTYTHTHTHTHTHTNVFVAHGHGRLNADWRADVLKDGNVQRKNGFIWLEHQERGAGSKIL